jgi:hypothetical protein
MAYLKDSTMIYGCRVWSRDTISSNPAYRVLHLDSSRKTLTRQRWGISNPKYKSAIANHVTATTQLDGSFNSLEAHRSRARITFIWAANGGDIQTREAYGDICAHATSVLTYTAFTSKADAWATSKFLKEIRRMEVKMSGPTFAGELRQTLRMLRKPAAGLQDGVRRYLDALRERNQSNRNRNFKKRPRQYSRELSKIASDSWLEYSFGWLPFINDIDGARDAYNDLFEIDRFERVSGGAIDEKLISSSTVSDPLTLPGSGILFLRNQRIVSSEMFRYRGGVRARAATTATDRLARFGFTPSEFLPTAWELLPWSFLVDYFANIGDILSAAVTDTSNVVWVNRSWVRQGTKVQTCSIDPASLTAYKNPPNRLLSVDESPGYSIFKTRIVNRSVGSTNAIWPTLTFNYPSSPARLLNIAALLVQVGIDLHPQKPSRRNYRL